MQIVAIVLIMDWWKCNRIGLQNFYSDCRIFIYFFKKRIALISGVPLVDTPQIRGVPFRTPQISGVSERHATIYNSGVPERQATDLWHVN